MKINSKTIYKILSFVLFFSMLLCSTIPVHAMNNANINVSSTTSYQGSTASVEIRLEDNPGIWGMKFKVNYNHEILTLKTVRNGTIFTDAEVTMSSDFNAKEFVYLACGDNLNNKIKDGVLVSLEFKVSNNAAYGSYPVSVTVSQIINKDSDDIDYQTTKGKVDIVKKAIIHTSSNNKPSSSTTNTSSHIQTDSTKVITMLQGQFSTYKKGTQQSLVFICDEESKNFMRIEVDGNVVDEKYYTLEGDQLKVTLLPEYLELLEEGEHILSIYSKNGVSTTTFHIVKENTTIVSDKEDTTVIQDNHNSTLYILGGIGVIVIAIVTLYISKGRRDQ